MRLKKFLKSSGRNGQALAEYFILLCVIATITLMGSSLFFERVGSVTNEFMDDSVRAMEQDNIENFNPAFHPNH